MRLKPEDKKKITTRIRAGAAKQFRLLGYDAVNLDMLMKEAGLTRGAFYAHYKTKAGLFADVVRNEHPLLQMLENRSGPTAQDLHDQMLAIFKDYLTPVNLEEVFNGCSMAALGGDVVRAGTEVKQGYDAAIQAICMEMARHQGHDPHKYLAPLMLATSAIRYARATDNEASQSAILLNAWAGFNTLLPAPSSQERHNS